LRLAVLGVGLIGGSIGLAARRRYGASVCGYDPDPRALATALELGAIDEQAPDIAAAVAGAEVVFAAAPVGVLAQTVREALALAGEDCVVSDVGSTKLALRDAREDVRFVGGHPLAGAETAGVEHAREDLFEGATWYLTPAPSADRALYARLRGVIECLGARPAEIEADAHDRLMARISHLPHVLANVLVLQAAEAFEGEDGPPSSGPSLRDTIRVAGANTAIWTDIYLANRDALIAAIEQAVAGLDDVCAALKRADGDALAAWNERARAARMQLLGETGMPAGGGRPPASAETGVPAEDACHPASAGETPPAGAAP
jgi:prephenate dehydrogenase